jgi:hypothetical protein
LHESKSLQCCLSAYFIHGNVLSVRIFVMNKFLRRAGKWNSKRKTAVHVRFFFQMANKLRDLGLPPRCSRCLRSVGMLRGVG